MIAQGIHLLPGRIVAVALLVTLVACSGQAGAVQTAQTEHYQVQLGLEGSGFGTRTATIIVRDQAGQPVAADQVVVAPVMREMGMASPELTAQPTGPGRYQAEGELFTMTGEWEVQVRVRVGGSEESTGFKVEVNN